MHLSRIPPGMRYYIGAEARLRRRVEDVAMSLFSRWSYEEITTPAVDYYPLFEHGMGVKEAQRSFRFTDNDGRILALRPDVTSTVARAAATLLIDVDRPLRLCYAAPVFRQQYHSSAEWRRESTQLGCELIGDGSVSADMEVLFLTAAILKEIGLASRFCITINDVEIFNGLAEQFSLNEVEREEIRRLIDSRAAPEVNSYLSDVDQRSTFSDLIQFRGKGDVLTRAFRLNSNARSMAGLVRLKDIWQAIEESELSDVFEIDLGDVSNLDYYTGLNFKVFVKGAGARVGGGGRYDTLIGNFGAAEAAVGFMLSLDALVDVLSNAKSNDRV